jgi:antitoxin VapB
MRNITTRVFKTGNSNAVRIPKEFKFRTNETVKIYQKGRKLIIDPIDKKDWIDSLFDNYLDEDNDFEPEEFRTKNRKLAL